MRATRIDAPLHIDGQLDEAAYTKIAPFSDFLQVEPVEGAPATEKTEFWVLFDDNFVYITGRCWESHPERMVVTEMRRDNNQIFANENFAFMLDTFHDKRSGVWFEINPVGGRMDGQITGERQVNLDWNPIWDLKTGTFDGGWTVEAAIPFKSLRYEGSRQQTWGLNVKRTNRWKNEVSFLVRVPNSGGNASITRTAFSADLLGIEAPISSRNVELKPYAIANLTTDRTLTPQVSNDADGDIGLDAKVGVTKGINADLTYRTDFAQVEADEQQVNLTRFSLIFPEKRDFFLENRGVFTFGGVGAGQGGPDQAAGAGPGNDAPTLFYSRSIGIADTGIVPIQGGGRVTGRAGKFTLGLMDLQTDKASTSSGPATNFSAVRVKRDILRRSSIGMLFTGRSRALAGPGDNVAYGADAALIFFANLNVNMYWAKTHTDGLRGKDTSYRAQVDYAGDRYGLQVERLVIGTDFNPEVGFARRKDIASNLARVRFSPRPQKRFKAVRKFSYSGFLKLMNDGTGRRVWRDWEGEYAVEFQNGDRVSAAYGDTFEYLPVPFKPGTNVTVPVGDYQYSSFRTGYTLGQKRTISGTFTFERGTFYDGNKTSFTATRGRMKFNTHLSIDPIYTLNNVDLIEGSFTSHLLGSRVTYTVTPLMFVSALIQYNSAANAVSSNVRLRWEYRPGSELFVVYNEQRDTLRNGFPDLMNKAFIVKANRLFRF